MSGRFTIRDATSDDADGMLALLPRLADFDIPKRREPRHLWQDDEKLLRRWIAGTADGCLVQVATDDNAILGVTMTSIRPEPLSHAPAAHLEVIAVVKGAEGRGIGTALMKAAEQNAKSHGALFMTLHVFASNTRARQLYEECGYDGEMLRYIKSLD